MVRGVGLDAGTFEIKVVELDGSYRKARLAKLSIERVRIDGAAAEADPKAALAPLDDVTIHRENLTLGVPCREAVLRTMTVPFGGVDNIRKVIKFETEGQIHSHSVDDMVVDFHVLDQPNTTETRVLVAAVPKDRLRSTLRALEAHGLEPEHADLDTMALFRAAEWCGVLGVAPPAVKPGKKESKHAKKDATKGAPPTEVVPVIGATSRLIFDIGARSIRLLVTSAGRLRDMRTLRIGADVVADEIAATYGVSALEARGAVERSLATGEDVSMAASADAAPAAPVAPVVEGAEASPTAVATAVVIPAATIREVRDRFLERLRRELFRSFAGVRDVGVIEAAYVTGGGSRLPGIVEVLDEAIGIPSQPLDVLGNLSHGLSEEEAREINPRIAVAVGLALRPLGGVAGFDFRQEDLVFTKQFDRIKFPLAITAMLALFLSVVYVLKAKKELDALEYEIGATYKTGGEQATPGQRGGSRNVPEFYGMVGSLVRKGSWFGNDTFFDGKAYQELTRKLLDVPVFQRVAFVRQELGNYLKKQQSESGVYEGLRIGSGYAVLNAAAKVIESAAPEMGRFLVSEVHMMLQPQAPNRYIEITFALRGEDHTRKYRAVEQRFEEATRDPKSPFSALSTGGPGRGGERPFRDGDLGAYYTLRVDVKPEATFPTYP